MHFRNTRRKQHALSLNGGLIVRGVLALLTTIGSILLAWTLMVGQPNARAAGLNEYSTTQNPWGVAFDYKHGYVWVAEPACNPSPSCTTPPAGLMGRYSMTNPGVGEKDFVPPTKTPYNPVFITLDKSENVWFTDPVHNMIGELDAKTNQWFTFKIPTANAGPVDLLFDQNSNLWFTENLTGNIGYYNTTTHKFVENAIPTANSSPYGIAIDKHGIIWFAEDSTHSIGSFKPTKSGILPSGAITEYTVSTSASPHMLAIDKKGNIWYSEGAAGSVGFYNVTKNTFVEYPVSASQCPTPTPKTTPPACSGTFVSGIGLDKFGFVWFDDSLAARVGKLLPVFDQVTIYQLPFSGAYPDAGLAVDKMDTVWFSELNSYRLGQIPQVVPPKPSPTPTTPTTPTATATKKV